MKKLNYFLTVVAGGMMLASCSNDNDVVTTVDDNAVQQIVLQVASNGDGLTTRAGRPLLSNEAAQDIDNVDLYIVNADKEVVYTYKNTNWKSAIDYTNGKMATITLTGDNKLAAGSYKVYALGYSNGSEYDIPTFKKDDVADLENYVLEYKNENSVPEEIFAGSFDLTVEEENRNFSESIILHRQVAGAYFYVYNLPMIKDLDTECKIQLVASDFNDQLVLGKFQLQDHGNNADETNVMYVVNGKKSENPVGSTVVCEATIGDWYSAIVDEDKDGVVDITKWISTIDASNRPGKGYVKGSIFASSFVMPFKNVGKQTLTLQIVDKDGTAVRTWNVNLPKAPNAPTYFDANSETPTFVVSSETEDVHNYSIVRNHLYCVGTKTKVEPYNPENPDPDPSDPDPDPKPDPDPDEPQDLSVGENLTLKVNHNWEVIYRMELE